ncbi:MAG: hypothetical protein K8I29_05065 [Alphaproteobacteria bacterium]|uniref:Uncharacterized protein n=1 Tax=Candidatus Nitrobium versatile TaxID=2884831 RepID=A0A953J940_9BACT|nr:hypothetical protein [Candidatus Nitrobium versatile]
MAHLENRIRFYHYISRVLEGQRSDPLCGSCKAFANTTARLKEGFAEMEEGYAEELRGLSAGMARLLAETRGRLASTTPGGNAVGQKRAGRCLMPEGVCFIKISKAIQEVL